MNHVVGDVPNTEITDGFAATLGLHLLLGLYRWIVSKKFVKFKSVQHGRYLNGI